MQDLTTPLPAGPKQDQNVLIHIFKAIFIRLIRQKSSLAKCFDGIKPRAERFKITAAAIPSQIQLYITGRPILVQGHGKLLVKEITELLNRVKGTQ